MPRRLLLLAVVVLATGLPRAAATPYMIAYEADTPGSFPEDEGWERGVGFGGAERTVQGGILTLSSENTSVFDFYEMDMGGNLDPDPGETFFAEWRLRVDANSSATSGDTSFGIARDNRGGGAFDGGAIVFEFFPDRVDEIFSGVSASFEPGVFHTFRIESETMDDYRFYIDGLLGFTDVFDSPDVLDSFVAFGDAIQGVASTSQWDFVRFGVVPEPGAVTIILFGAALSFRRGRRWNARRHICKRAAMRSARIGMDGRESGFGAPFGE